MKIYDIEDSFDNQSSSVSLHSDTSFHRLYYHESNSTPGKNKIERRIEILELHDLLLEDLCEEESIPINQKVYQIELLDENQYNSKNEEK